MELPNLPKRITKDPHSTNCSIFLHDDTLMVFGGTFNGYVVMKDSYACIVNKPSKCFQLENGAWKEHSTLNHERYNCATVSTVKGTFVFGGDATMCGSSKSYEYLPIGSRIWKNGKRNQIPGGFESGCAIEVKSRNEIWLIGGWPYYNNERILSFDMDSHTFKELPFKLIKGRHGHACAYIPGTTKLLVTGGVGHEEDLNQTEIIDTETGTVTMAGLMNVPRRYHGMGIVEFNGEQRVAVFGGYFGRVNNSVELFDTKTQKWEFADELKLNIPRMSFGFVSI